MPHTSQPRSLCDMRRRTPLWMLSRFCDVLLGSFLVLGASAALASFGAHDTGRPAGVFGRAAFTVLSGSMAPALHTGDLVFADTSVDTTVIAPGDVIVFRAANDPSRLVTHRVTRVFTEGASHNFATKGDANPGPDATPVPASAVVGKMTGHVPDLGYMLAAATDLRSVALVATTSVLAHLALVVVRPGSPHTALRDSGGTHTGTLHGSSDTERQTT